MKVTLLLDMIFNTFCLGLQINLKM